MQGFILSSTKIKNQDLILRILTPSHILQLYRFYGVRHSIIDVGRKIDFDIQNDGLFIPKLRNILQLGFSWEKEFDRVYIWKTFISLLNTHLRDVENLEEFYFELLEWGGHTLRRQNPMRVALEMYAKLLLYEGRSARCHSSECFVCGEMLESEVVLGRAFLLAHPRCVDGYKMRKDKIVRFLDETSSVELEDGEIERLWGVFSQGL